jgi:hypothetical protein
MIFLKFEKITYKKVSEYKYKYIKYKTKLLNPKIKELQRY